MRTAAATLALAICLVIPPAVLPANAASPWTGVRSPDPGWTVISDGTGSPPQLSYSRGADLSGTYRFMTTASEAGTVTLPWTYQGHHSWYQAYAFVRPVIRRSGTYVYPGAYLVSGPAPGGFHFQGSVGFPVAAGDEYGFEFGGSHFDAAYILQGTFTVELVPGTSGVPGNAGVAALELYRNAPDPVSGETTFRYQLPGAGEVDLSVYDVRGSRVAVVESGPRPAGPHEIAWAPHGLPSGVYYYRLTWGHQQRMHKLLIAR